MTQEQREGAAREAVVTADLLRRGFDVFSAACGNPPFDLVAYKSGIMLRVEVKGKHKAPHSNMPIGTTAKRSHGDCREFDIFAAVDGSAVRYIRSVLHTFNAASKELVGEELISPKTRKDYIARRSAMQKETQC